MTEAIEYVWEVPNLEFTLVDGDKQNVVTIIHWTVTKTLDSHSFSSHGNVSISAPSGSFVEYENITEALAIEWAKNALGTDKVSEIEAAVNAAVTELANPTKSSGVPWTESGI